MTRHDTPACRSMTLRVAALLALLALLELPAASAQLEGPSASAPGAAPGIQDNSFLMEEAYNQEWGVVQHISGLSRSLDGGGWVYTFTQEWPLRGIKHQLSFSLPLQHAEAGDGLGDLALNYRYQLLGSGEARVACAPRLSLVLPTGNERQGLGAGGLGLQTNVAASFVLSARLVTHLNLGGTRVPSARNASGQKAGTTAVNAGHSLVWLASPRFNVLVETVWVRSHSVVGHGATERSDSLLVSPGIRWAYNFASGLQIVPGIALPIGVGPSRGERSLFLYLSFEHPFKRRQSL